MQESANYSSSVLEATTGELVLKVRGAIRDGQVVRDGQTVRLSSPKCTIGSGSNCTLRLRARGVGPVHCLVLRGAERTIVRRWLPDTRLNGGTFDEAELSVGDHLSIGPIELEVIELGDPASMDDNCPADSEQAREREIETLTRQLSLANYQGRQRTRSLVEQLRDARAEVARLQGSIDATPAAERSPTNEFREREKETAHAAIASEQSDPAAGSPVERSGVLHRMKHDSPKTGGVDAAAQVPVQSEPDWQTDRPQPPAEPEEGESVDDYMAKLMQRVRAQTSEAAPSTPWKPSETPRPDPEPAQQAPETPESNIEGYPEQGDQADLTKMSPRAVAPERLTDLAAMRQLANVSAQSAIEGHSREQIKMAIRTKLLIMAVGLAVGGALTWFWWAMNGGDIALYSAFVCFLVVVLWGIQYAILTGKMIINRTGSLDVNSKPKSNANEKSQPQDAGRQSSSDG